MGRSRMPKGHRWTTAATPRRARCRQPTNRWRIADMDLMTWLPVAWFAVIGFGVLIRGAAGPDDEHRRADLGRQRNLAGAGWRRPAGGVPEGVRGASVGAVPAGAAAGGGAGVPWRGLRVPLQGAPLTPVVERGVRTGLAAGHLRPGRDPRHAGAGPAPAGRRLSRWPVRLVQSVRDVDRRRAGGRLRAAGQYLADPEDRRPGAGAGAADDPAAGGGGDRGDGPGQQLAAVPAVAPDGPLVQRWQLLVAVAGTAADPGGGGRVVAQSHPSAP
ncbi:hypothetical protein G6F59_013586 [Rhizopus arrhizus]|nr:hypothetical protein G6F59_013586 [Rhizopus arrhizus]